MSSTRDAPPPGVRTRRLAIYYALLGIVTTLVVIWVVSQGSHRHAQVQIAGGYDVTAGATCLGQQFNIAQSGQFATLDDPQGGASGKLSFKNSRLTGTVDCADHASRRVDLAYSGGSLIGTIGGAPASAQFRRDPPAPGAPKPKAPPSIAGDYQLAPGSQCLGGRITLDGSGGNVELVAGAKKRG